MSRVARASALVFGVVVVQACGGTDGTGVKHDVAGNLPAPPPVSSGSASGSADPPPDGPPTPSGPKGPYPAFTPDFPRLVNNGGFVLKNPTIVTITFASDPNADTYEALGDAIGGSPYWATITGEYGVGPATSGAANHVRVAQAPNIVLTDPNNDPGTQLEAWLTSQLTATPSPLPAPTNQTIYSMHLSGAVAQHFCDTGAEGYHSTITLAGKSVVYAVTNLCTTNDGATPLEDATATATHELAEATLDPWPSATPNGWQGLDDDHLAWELMQDFQDENGDMCEYYDDVDGTYGAPSLGVFVQRQWSNKSAAAGHAPCVPALASPYFNVVALGATDTVAADFSSVSDQVPSVNPVSKGVRVAVGETKAVKLGVYSDGPTPAVTLSAIEINPFDPNADWVTPTSTPTLDLSLDKTSGYNGDTVTLSVRVDKATPTGIALVLVRSTVAGETHPMPILVGQNATAPTPKGAGATKPRRSHHRRRL